MASHEPSFPKSDEKPAMPPKYGVRLDLKDPVWWAVGGAAFMALALVFMLVVVP